MSESSHVNAANRYARSVVAGKLPACRLVRSACRRHLDDLGREKLQTFPFKFNKRKAERTCNHIERQVHVKGKWAGKPLRLEPWQAFIFCVLFGWTEKATGLRRFRKAYIEVPRKNGKSVIAAGIGNYMLTADEEKGAEVYCGATSEAQAWEVFRPAKLMMEQTPGMADFYSVEVNARSMVATGTASRFHPVIGRPGDGSSPSCAIVDEYHEHQTPDLHDTMLTGMGAREQPIMLIITTAGTNLAGPCKAQHDEVVKLLDGLTENDQLFGIIYTIDDEDDWTNFDTWKKANPNLGVSVFEDFLRAQLRDACQNAHKQNIIKTKHLNVWCNANTAWMNMLKWNACSDPSISLEQFEGMPCVAALDLASKVDIAALMLLFWKDGRYYVFGRYYLPRETVDLPQNRHYQTWEIEELLTVTPGAVTDYEYIKEDLRRFRMMFEIKSVPFDPFQATQFSSEMMAEDFPMVEIGATVKNFSEPMKELERLVLDKTISFDGDKVLTWMMSNVVAHYDAKDNIFPRKERNENKIDGVVALIMGLNMAMRHQNEQPVTPGIAIL